MAINFPHNPNVNDVHTEASLGRSWKWDGTSWLIYSSTTTGIAFGDLSVSQQAASGSGSLTYNNAGVFTYTPPAGGGGGGGSSTFIGLNDTPNSLTAGKWLKVNTGGTALEWTDAPAGANTTYDLTASNGSVATEEKIILSGSDSSEDAVTLAVSGNLTIARSNNTITFGGSVPTTITVADESTEVLCYPLFTTTATGNLAPKTGSNIKFNSSSGQLEAGSFKKTGGVAAEFLKADGSTDSSTYSTFSGSYTDLTNKPTLVSNLNDLSDVDTTGATNGKIIKHNGTSWVIADDQSGGAGGGGGNVAVGSIMIWSGAVVDIPTGWQLCNGTNGSPDLRDKFVIGAGDNYNVAATGGSKDSILVLHSHTINNHTHSFSDSFSGNTDYFDTSHTHGFSNNATANVQTAYGTGSNALYGGSTSAMNSGTVPISFTLSDTGGPSANSNHRHGFSGSVSGTTGNPSDTGTNNQGSSGTDANLPPYYALCYIYCTAAGSNQNFVGLFDTPSSHSNDKWLKSNGSALIWTDAPAGNNTTYDLTGVATSNGFKTRLTGSDSTEDDVEFTPGGGISYTVTGNTCQISSVNTISGLSDVSLNGSPSNGQVLKYNGTNWTNDTDASGGGADGNTTYDLSGVATTNGAKVRLSGSDSTEDDVEFTAAGGISYSVSGSTIEISSLNTLSGLSDTTITSSPTNGWVLAYDTGDSKWKPAAPSSGADGNDYVTNLSLSGTTLTAEFGNSSLNQSIDLASIDTNTNTTYSISCLDGDNADEEKIRLTAGGSGSSVDDIVLEAGTGLTISRSGDKITFANSETNTNTTYGLSGVATGSGAKIRLTGSGGATNDVELTAGGGISYSVSGNTIQISSLNSLSGLSDTDISGSPSTGDVLKWNGSNWAAGTDNSGGGADGNNYANSLSFNTGNGILTVGRSGLTDLTVDLDNRYAIGTIPTNNNQLTNGAGYITSSGNAATATTATNANNVKIRTDNDASWHYPLFVDSNTDNQNQTLKVDASGMKYYPSLGWLQNTALQSYIIYDWAASSGNSGDVLTSGGSGQWSWTTPSSGGMTGNSKVTTYTSGNGTHTTQSWCKTVIAALVGAGGGGGNAAAFYDDDDSPTTGYGGGGGSGGVSFYTNNVSGATSISYSVGTGGSAQSSANCDDSPANGAAGTNTGFGGTTAGGGGGGQGVGQSGNGAGGAGGSGNLSGMVGGSGQDNNMRAVTPFFGKYGYGGRGADGSGLTGGDSKCNGGAENGENGAIIVLELG